MIYIMSGMATEWHQLADTTGLFRGVSTHHSVHGCWNMRFDASVVTTEQSSVCTSDTHDPQAGVMARVLGCPPGYVLAAAVLAVLFDIRPGTLARGCP
ncbi:MAG: hypothetical protein H7274_19530 [Rhodoferax sp.]|nr:hypothetical protein [Rhodoferax sp.]